MQVLLTNDDGVDAAGIRAMRAALIPHVDCVVTVAPERNCTGFARMCTFDRPVRVTRQEAGAHPVFACDGTPTDCVRAGILGRLAPDAVLVVSGINHGANLADDITVSGTIGAGMEGAVLGLPALCVSQQTPSGTFAVNYHEDKASVRYDFDESADLAARLAIAMASIQGPEPLVLSMNYPAERRGAGLRLTRPGRRAYPQQSQAPWAPGESTRLLYLYGGVDEQVPNHDEGPNTDIGALRDGIVSVTPLSLCFDAHLDAHADAGTAYLETVLAAAT